MAEKLKLGLFAPGMTALHRVGLAGLYISLKAFERSRTRIPNLTWELDSHSVHLAWKGDAKKVFDSLLKKAFLLDEKGMIAFAAHQSKGLGDLEQVSLHDCLLATYLQHGKSRGKGKKQSIVFSIDRRQVTREYLSVPHYAHQKAADELFSKQGKIKTKIPIAGWSIPGGGVRHVAFTGPTKLEESFDKFICLLFAPVATMYFRISHKGSDGKYDARKGAALVFPHLTDLEAYETGYTHYLQSPVERLTADGVGDAGLLAMLALRTDRSLEDLGVEGATAIILGTVGWSKQQKTRTDAASFGRLEEDDLNTFELACRLFPNERVIKEQKAKKGDQPQFTFFVSSRPARGLFAQNIAIGRPWYSDFWELMKTQQSANHVSRFERKGLYAMTQEAPWPYEADKLFVEAMHAAVRNRYGALAAQAKSRGEKIPFQREFERMRTSMMRVKNAQTLRAEVADMLARGGVNSALKQHWRDLLPLFSGDDWKRARDLTLLALASYSGAGSKELETDDNPNEEGESL